MVTLQSPAAITFTVQASMEALVRIMNELPSTYDHLRIPEAAITFTEGPFGHYFSQELSSREWLINWQQYHITQRVTLQASIRQPAAILCCVTQGDFTFRLRAHEVHTQSAGTCTFYYMPPQVSNLLTLEPGIYQLMYISFSPNYIAEFTELHPWFHQAYKRLQGKAATAQALPTFPLDAAAADVLQRMQQCQSPGPGRKFFFHARITDLVLLYFSHHCTQLPVEDKNTESIMLSTAAFIRKNFHQQLTIPQLSQQAGMNITTFERTFKKVIGHSPLNYIVGCRLQEAANLLSTTAVSVKDVSNNVGFTNPNYFGIVFKKHFGFTPLDYRRKNSA
ncbi:helix-turn-helix transcriptional regulator [Chitinophaga vietnamensis]|uniref:helix-turn-helix transcriptional regulator n=1 Tax=Chitinophaga vietnamensis TaxID=2593957 RepID=UPI001178BE18|nr:AraC family transcriptional regulator [Chitinophaga vietnamensis]